MRIKIFFIFVLINIFFVSASGAQDIPQLFPKEGLKDFNKKTPVVVNGDRVEYLQGESKIRGFGNISVTYGEVKLTCDNITVHTDTQIGVCEGNVKITQPGAVFTGQKVTYNFAEKTGEVLDGKLRAEPFYASAEKIAKVSEKKVILEKGSFTTCDLEHPHYRIAAKQVIFYLNDKIIAKHVFIYVGKVPIFYMPYYVQPLRDTKTKITVIPGYSDNWGYYALGSYRYYFSEQCKGYLRLDYRHKRGLGEGIDYNFDAGQLGEGSARFYYTQENNSLAISPGEDIKDRYRFQYKHRIELPEDTIGMIEFNKVSDRDMIKDYFFNELEEGWTPDNYISIVTTKPNYSFEVLARKRLDEFFTVTERLPELKLQVYNQRLWDTKFYYANDMSVTNFRKRYADFENIQDEEAVRVDTYNRLSYVTKVLNFLYTTPYMATRQTFYSRNRLEGQKTVLREIYEYGVSFSTKFYKILNVSKEKLEIKGLRHVITPTVTFRHRHQPTVSPDNLFQFDGIDALDYENLIAMSIENKLQTKRKLGDGWTNVDLVRFIVSTDYLYRFKKGNMGFHEGKFSDIRFELEVQPYSWLFAKTDITMYVKDWVLRDAVKHANTDVVIDLGEKFSFGMGHSYDNSEGNSASLFTLEAQYKINDDWGLRVYERFDAYKRTWEEQEYTVYKDLHCWLAEFTVSVNDGFAFWVVFRLKAFPDIPIGLKRTYRRPTPGATTL